MNTEVHILSHDAEEMLPWAIRHYQTFASRIVVHNGGPGNVSARVAEELHVECKPWDTAGQLNDELARHLKNNCWRATPADWVIVVDADELIYFPQGPALTLGCYEKLNCSVVKPHGFEMFATEFPSFYRLDPVYQRGVQFYDIVKDGSPDNEWYAKPVLFSPKRIADSGFGIGAHESIPTLADGRQIMVNATFPKANPETWLLHCHQVGPIERVAARYDATRKRLASVNERNGWGNFKPGLEHAREKRLRIAPGLRRVIA